MIAYCRAVGVLVDYFAATADELGTEKLLEPGGPAGAGWPHVDCKGWLDGLRDLAADLTGRDRGEFGRDELVHADSEDDGPWLTRVDDGVVAALAGVDDDRLAAYADNESLHEHEAQRCLALRDLARSAGEHARQVYCWSSL
jgi:hypothetical protein